MKKKLNEILIFFGEKILRKKNSFTIYSEIKVIRMKYFLNLKTV
jgi:hypothetical protein